MHFLVPIADRKRMQVGILEIERERDGWYKVTITTQEPSALIVYVSPHDGRIAFCDRSADG